MARHVLLVALALVVQGGDDPGPGWTRYVARKGGFAVRVPARPRETDERAVAGETTVAYHSLASTDGRAIYSVVFHDNRPIPASSRAAYLKRQAESDVEAKRGELLTQRPITLGEHPGRALTFEAPPGRGQGSERLLYSTRLYLVGDRLYQVIAVAPKGRADPRAISAFLDSFELVAGEPAAPGGDPGEWATFTSHPGGFSIKFPVEPTERTAEVETPSGPIPTVNIGAQDGAVGYTVSYVDYSTAAARSPKRLLDGTRDAAVRGSGGKLLHERRFTLGRNPGREFEAEIPVGDDPKAGRMRCRIYLVRRRVVQVTAAGPREALTPEATDRFFQSFKLIAK